MNLILHKIQTTYSFSDHEIGVLKYGIEIILGELSKCLIMLIYFYAVHKTPEYLAALILLLLLRSNMGGLHMKHYWSCFLLTFIFMNAAVIILPFLVTLSKSEICLILLLCIVIGLQIGPVHAKFIRTPNSLLIRKARIQTSYILILYLSAVVILPVSKYVVIGFWIIVLQTFQLIIAKGKEMITDEKQIKK